MIFASAILAGLAALNVATAAPLESRDIDPNKACPAKGPFALKVVSKSHTFNNHYIEGYHIGAGINLAVVESHSIKGQSDFYLNYTSYSFNEDGNGNPTGPVDCTYGALAYAVAPNLPFQGGLNVNLTSNVAQLWLSIIDDLPGTGQFQFNHKGELTLGGAQRWLGCESSFEGYGPYPAVNWEFGTGAPTDKSCVPITIVKA